MASGVRNFSTRWNDDRFEKLDTDFIVVKKKTKSLLTILNENNCPKVVDYLAIDVEGSEEKIINFAFIRYRKILGII